MGQEVCYFRRCAFEHGGIFGLGRNFDFSLSQVDDGHDGRGPQRCIFSLAVQEVERLGLCVDNERVIDRGNRCDGVVATIQLAVESLLVVLLREIHLVVDRFAIGRDEVLCPIAEVNVGNSAVAPIECGKDRLRLDRCERLIESLQIDCSVAFAGE